MNDEVTEATRLRLARILDAIDGVDFRGEVWRLNKAGYVCGACGKHEKEITKHTTHTRHANRCWPKKLQELETNPKYASVIAYLELQDEQLQDGDRK